MTENIKIKGGFIRKWYWRTDFTNGTSLSFVRTIDMCIIDHYRLPYLSIVKYDFLFYQI